VTLIAETSVSHRRRLYDAWSEAGAGNLVQVHAARVIENTVASADVVKMTLWYQFRMHVPQGAFAGHDIRANTKLKAESRIPP
jgi:hypothetical protein